MAGLLPTMPGRGSSERGSLDASGAIWTPLTDLEFRRLYQHMNAGNAPTSGVAGGGSRKLLPAGGQQRRQALRGQAGLVQHQALHLLQHEVAEVVAGPPLFEQVPADRLQAAVAQPGRLPGNVALVDAEQGG